ncbi:MAG: type II CAAX prenyl endopeptidase Rce1 family protein [Flavobacteriales bacterium]
MIRTSFQRMHPFLQFIFIICLIFSGMAVASFSGVFLVSAALGHSLEEAMAIASSANSEEGKYYNLFVNGLNQLFAFGLVAGFVGWLFSQRTFVTFRSLSWQWLIIGIMLAWAAQPLIDLTFRLNDGLITFLPDAWAETIYNLEATATDITRSMLTFDTTWQFLATALTVAVLPAVCEELIFRGVLQPLISKWTGNAHLGIWVSALLFSAIHLQFQGFLPRMILGAGLGYLVVYSQSLWPSIAAHFFNNFAAIFMAYYMGPEWIETEMNAVSAWDYQDFLVAIVALMIGVLAILWVRKLGKWTDDHPVTDVTVSQ